MKKITLWLVLLTVAHTWMASGAHAAGDVIQLSYATVFPPTHVHSQLGQAWADEITKRTNGRVKINFYPGSALLKGDKVYSGVESGIADIGMSIFVYNRGMFPAMEVVDLPLGFTSGKMATYVINEFYKRYPPEKLDAQVKVLYLHAHGPGLLHCKKPVRKLEDLQGLKIRGQGATARIISALGAAPVAMDQAEAYEALQKGVVDGNFSPMEVLKGWRQAEVIHYTTESYGIGYSSTFYLIMNKRKWDALPADVQKVFDEVDPQWAQKHAAAWDRIDEEARAYTLEKGNEIIPLSKEENARWQAAVQPVIAEYIKDVDRRGLPGEEYIKTARELIEKYQQEK
ncbi:MAG: TRAP transporter substrate-binding protein [Desulfopila sp.]